MDSVVSAPVAGSGAFAADAAAFSAYWRDLKDRLARLPAKPQRDAKTRDIAESLKQAARDARYAFLRCHARTLYDRLTGGRRHLVPIRGLGFPPPQAGPGPGPAPPPPRPRSRLSPAPPGPG